MNFKGRSRGRSRKNSTFNVVLNTEKWKNSTKKIKRNSNDQADDSEDEDQTSDVKDWVKEFFGRMSLLNKEQDVDEEVHLNKKQTTILSTLVPDELLIMNNLSSPQSKRFVGVLLMADVSGYTALSEKYNSIGKSGTYRLTVTLNTYLGALVELIYSHGGDIIKFAGDAFLALWKTDKKSFLSHTIHSVICCALVIQHSYATYETDVKVNLKVKLAISAGNLTFATIGSGADMNYVIIGLPISEAKLAESVCTSGKVSLSPTAWAHCYTRNYDYIVHDDGHVTINAILYDPRESDVSKPFAGITSVTRQVKPTLHCANTPDSFWENLDHNKNHYLSTLRNTIYLAQEKDIGKYVRLFMIKPVLTQVDAHQPLEYLTEMRQVSILFITLKPAECPLPQLISIVDNSYQITCEIVYKSLGCVNKIILFDKDVMILVIFGLRGFKHESEAQAALKCACIIRKSVSALNGVQRVSIGITTGVVYCGVIGHPLRREFTVIGAIVNKAARLMCYYHNKITCDENTFIKSKMSSNGFTLQEPLQLKGIKDAGKIYEYTEEIRVKELYSIPVIPPLLNRADEISLFEQWVITPRQSYDCLLYIGEVRIGKTRLLEWLKRCAEKLNVKTCYLSLTSIHCSTPYLAINQIVNQILDLTEPIAGFKKEEKILEMMNSQFDDLCYLNDILNVRFAYQEGTFSQDNNIRKTKTKTVFQKFLSFIKTKYVLFYDDLQNLDASSWEFLQLMFNSPNIFTVITLNRGKLSSMHRWLSEVLGNEKIKKIVLGPLAPQWVAPLACQILDVDGVPTELCKVLIAKCKCMPGMVENFLIHLFSSGALTTQILSEEELEEDEEFEFPDKEKILSSALHIDDQLYLENMQAQNSVLEKKVCTIVNRLELETNINDQNLDALIMMQIDSLTPYQQLLLKIGSVIGNTVQRALLENIMYENDKILTAKSIKKFFEMKIISCRQAKDKWACKSFERMSCVSETQTQGFYCDCDFDYEPEDNENLPKYAFCKVMRFKNKASRKTCYELLPLNQKKEFHTRILIYLENNYKQKCYSCGGQIMLGQSLFFDQSDIGESSDASACISNTDDDDGKTDDLRQMEKLSYRIENNHDTDDHLIPMDIISATSKITTASESNKLALHKSHSSNTQDTILSRRPTKRVTISKHPFYSNDLPESSETTVFDQLRAIIEAKTISDWRQLGIRDSTEDLLADNALCSQYIDFKIERGTSAIDFGRCSCVELTIHIYEQIIYHAIQAELKLKAVYFMIKYSYLNLRCNNPDNVIPKLTEAEDICLEKKTEIKRSDFKKYLGQIYALRAYAFLISGNLLAAKFDIEHASRILQATGFKKTAFFKVYHKMFHKLIRKKCPKDRSFYMNYILFYNVATLIYSTLEEANIAKASSLVALDLAQCVHYNIVEVLDAFSNALQVEMDLGFAQSIVQIENIIKVSIKRLYRPIKGDELFALGKLLMTLFRAEVFRGQIISGIRYGYQAAVVSRFLHIDNILLDLAPDLFYVLLTRGRVAEAVSVVRLIYTNKNCRANYDCEIWYHALCLDMILDGGFQLESIDAINHYGESLLRNRRYTSEVCSRRLAAGLWVYWLRSGCDRKAKLYESVALNLHEKAEDCGSLSSLISAMRIAEGMLESLSKKIDDLRKVVHVMELRSVAEKELLRLQRDSELLETIHPRWLCLKAHTFNICNLKSSANTKYIQAFEKSKKINNHLEKSNVLAVAYDSNFWIRNCDNRLFPSWRVINEYVKDSWHFFMYRMIGAQLSIS